MRIGLFGGSFDPVHNAHLALARVALRELQLDQLRWLPARQPWQKTRAMAAPEHRVAMLQQAMAGEPRFVLDRCELDRPGPTYSIDTVRALRAQWPLAELFLVIGQDQYARFHTWVDWRDIASQVTLAVAERPGVETQADAAVQAFAHRRLALPPLDISATDIRSRAARGEPLAHLVPPGVAGYIDSHGLYRPVHT